MSAPVVWFEVMGQDAAKLRSFYGQLFGWSFVPMDNDYSMVDKTDDGIPGGVGKSPVGAGHTTFYVQVDSIDDTLAAAVAEGGQVAVPKTELPDLFVALFTDPEGHLVGLAEQKAA